MFSIRFFIIFFMVINLENETSYLALYRKNHNFV